MSLSILDFYKQFTKELLAELVKQQIPINSINVMPITNQNSYVGTIMIMFKSYTQYMLAFLTETGLVQPHPLDHPCNLHHRQVYTCVKKWCEYVYSRFYAAEHIKDFWKDTKEELVATVWHPKRVAKWLEAGIDVEAL